MNFDTYQEMIKSFGKPQNNLRHYNREIKEKSKEKSFIHKMYIWFFYLFMIATYQGIQVNKVNKTIYFGS